MSAPLIKFAVLVASLSFTSTLLAETSPERQGSGHDNAFDKFLDADEVLGGQFSLWTEIATDYVFRGESETNDGDIMSLKASLTWTHNTGIYAGLYIANNLFPKIPTQENPDGHNLKINSIHGPYLGYAGPIGNTGFNYNGFLFHYIYRGDNNSNYLEMFNYVDRQFGDVNIKLEYSPTLSDWFGVKGLNSHNVALHVSTKAPHGFTVSGTIGRQMFNTGKSKSTYDYDGNGKTELDWTHWNIGVSRNIWGFNLDLRYHDTDIKVGDNDLYGRPYNNQIVDSRFVAALSKTY